MLSGRPDCSNPTVVATKLSDLRHRETALIGIIEKNVEIARCVTEHSQQQRNLPSVMDPMDGGVVHQVSQRR